MSGQADEGLDSVTHLENFEHTILLRAIDPANAYHVTGVVNNVSVRFMIDTGAAVSLIRKDIWEKIAPKGGVQLEAWTKHLVGVEGSPLSVLGATSLNITLAGTVVSGDFLVAKALSAEAIMGLDFLESQGCVINTGQSVIHLKGRAIPLSRESKAHMSNVNIRAKERLQIPAYSGIETLAQISLNGEVDPAVGWIVEPLLSDDMPALVANAIVTPFKQGEIITVPVRLINPSPQPVVINKGMKLAQMSKCADNCAIRSVDIAAENQLPSDIPIQKQQALWDMIERCDEALSEEQQRKLYNLLLSHADVFATGDDDLGRTNHLSHTISTGNHGPIRQHARRMPPYQRSEVKELLENMLSRDVIQPSNSPWASPIVVVRKKDGSARFCVDYRKLNSITHKDAYPLPRIDDTLDTLAGSQWFSTLDLVSGYWQVEVAENDRAKTAFITQEGLFEFKVMPFGLCNAPATFQRLMNLVLAGVQWSECLVYLDDIIVLGKSYEDHLRNLSTVLHKLQCANLRLKLPKCNFCRKEVLYLGHKVSREGVSTDPAKVEKVTNWPTPTSTQEVQQFLGLSSYYRKFIKNFASIARPLQRLTERGRAFAWTTECANSFAVLKQQLTSAPILVFPDCSKLFILDTDASQDGIGAVLSQIHDGAERVVAYASRSMTKAERKYCVTRKELLAVVSFTKLFRPYLLGHPFQLRTDHGSLTWLQNFKDPCGQLARWLEQLQEFDFEIIHRRGVKHQNADALSRRPCQQCQRPDSECDASRNTVVNDVVCVSQVPLFEPRLSSMATQVQGSEPDESIREVQLADPIIGPVLRAKEEGKPPTAELTTASNYHTRQLVQQWDQLTIKDGILYRNFESNDGTKHTLRMIVPSQLQEKVLREVHGGRLSGHLGETKTLLRSRERFYWPGMSRSVSDWCRTCPSCAARKGTGQRRRGALHNVKTGYPLELIAMDIVGPFPPSKSGNKYILVVSDYFTKWVEAFGIPSQDAVTVANCIVDSVFCRWGLPSQLHSDMGAQFESLIIKEISKILCINKTHTTPYHPQCDGLVERLNRTILAMLATMVNDHGSSWEDHLPKVCFAYNTSTHTSTGYTPFYMMYGREAKIPADIVYGTPAEQPQTHSQYASNLRQSLEKAYSQARKEMNTAAQRQKSLYDKKVHGEPYKVGDLVWLLNPAVPKGKSRKLNCPWIGPFRVVKKLSDIVYRIQDSCNRRKRQVVHFDRLKPCDPNMRTSQENVQGNQTPTRGNSPTLAPSSRPIPPGTNLQLLDDDDDDDMDSQPAGILTDPTPAVTNQPRRYPTRTFRRRPARYADGHE